MNKKAIIHIVKTNKIANKLFSTFGHALLTILSLFCQTDNKLILFNSFGGAKYDDSPKKIYEMMLNDNRFNKYKLVWAFNDPLKFSDVSCSIKSDGLKYFITALKARCWVTNSSIQRGIDFKGKKTLSFNTWHGTPLKKMGASINQEFNNKIISNSDIILTQSHYETEKMSEAWRLPVSRFREFGYPRNDGLAIVSKDEQNNAKEKLGLPKEKKVILYAPTFRDYEVENNLITMNNVPLDYDYWESKLSKKWIFILRAHYEVAKKMKLPTSGMWYDFSDYPSLNDLMIAADVLISDYSSILFDFSILDRIMFGYIYDYDIYNEKRGLYFDVRKELSCFSTDKDLVDTIININKEEEIKKTRCFREKYVTEYGNATKKSLDIIYEMIQN